MDKNLYIDIEGSKTVTCPPGQTVLWALEQHGVTRALSGCRGGGCGICKVQVLSGDISTQAMSCTHIGPEEKSAGIFLACCIRPESALKIRLLEAGAG